MKQKLKLRKNYTTKFCDIKTNRNGKNLQLELDQFALYLLSRVCTPSLSPNSLHKSSRNAISMSFPTIHPAALPSRERYLQSCQSSELYANWNKITHDLPDKKNKAENQEKLKWKNWTTSSEGLNDKLNEISKQDKQEKGKAVKDSTQKRT